MSSKVGYEAELKAANYLKKSGYEILKRNFRSKFGEIDIIAKKSGVIHFVEVKSSIKYDPIYAITPAKLKKILACVDYYLLLNEVYGPFQIDAILVKGNEIEYIENITY